MLETNDALHRFRLQHAGVRGGIVHLEASWHEILEHASYPAEVTRLLGEALAASALFAGQITFEGRLSIQLHGAGALRLLFAECTHHGRLRGIARLDDAKSRARVALDQAGARLAITIENAQTDSRHQGLVPVEGDSLSSAFEGYFERSEQLPTRIVLAAGAGRCAGILLQQVPDAGGRAAANDPDGWNRVGMLLATLTERELLDLPAETLLGRLFHEEGVWLDESRPLGFECSCSRERVVAMLRALGPAEGVAALDAQGIVEITCEFCNRQYRFDRVDVAGLFAGMPAAPGSPTPH